MVDSGWDALEALDATVLRDRSACEHAWRLGRTADFRLGDLAATGLGDGSVDAVLCVDAIQFAQQPNAAYCELQRVWGPLGQDDERLPAACGGVDLAAGLTAVGFSNIEV